MRIFESLYSPEMVETYLSQLPPTKAAQEEKLQAASRLEALFKQVSPRRTYSLISSLHDCIVLSYRTSVELKFENFKPVEVFAPFSVNCGTVVKSMNLLELIQHFSAKTFCMADEIERVNTLLSRATFECERYSMVEDMFYLFGIESDEDDDYLVAHNKANTILMERLGWGRFMKNSRMYETKRINVLLHQLNPSRETAKASKQNEIGDDDENDEDYR